MEMQINKADTLFKRSVWGYLTLVICLVAIVYYFGDQWWLATILLFSPRWLLLLPFFILVPFAFRSNRRLLIPLALAALIVIILFMDFNIPLSFTAISNHTKPDVIRILTLNVDMGKCDFGQLFTLIRDSSVDVVAFQECPEGLKLPLPQGWHIISARGLAVISHFPLSMGNALQITPPHSVWPGTYLLHTILHAPGGDVAFCSVQFPTPRFGLQQVLDRYTFLNSAKKNILIEDTFFRWRVAREVRRYSDTLLLPVIIAGDFNTPTDSTMYRQIWGQFTNAFSNVGLGFGWTQRVAIHGFPFSIRIDHILTGMGLTPGICGVGKDVGSDHLPLMADIYRDR